MHEFDRLASLLQWRLEYFGRIMNVLEEVADRLDRLVADMIKRERAILDFCKNAKHAKDLDKACRLVMWSYRVVDCVFNYETSNAVAALRHVDHILGEKNA